MAPPGSSSSLSCLANPLEPRPNRDTNTLNPSYAHATLGLNPSPPRYISDLQSAKLAEFHQLVQDQSWAPSLGEIDASPIVREWAARLVWQKYIFLGIAATGVPWLPDIEMVAEMARSPRAAERRVSWGDMVGLCNVLEGVRQMVPQMRLEGFGGPDDYGQMWMKFHKVCDA